MDAAFSSLQADQNRGHGALCRPRPALVARHQRPGLDSLAGEQGLVLNLITACSYGQHNTVVYKQGDSYRGIPHRQTILVNPRIWLPVACGPTSR